MFGRKHKMLKNLYSEESVQSWRIESNDGDHIAIVKTTSMMEASLDLFVDNIFIKSIPKKLGVWDSFDFTCGGETLTLVYCGAIMDIAHRGMLINKKIPYRPNDILPKWHKILFMVIDLLAIAACVVLSILCKLKEFIPFMCLISCMVSVCSAMITKMISTSPLFLKSKKYLFVTLIALLAWFIGAVCPFWFSFMGSL